MGFAADTAITADADFFKLGFEQEITNVLRESGETDLSKLQKEAVNLIIRDCRSLGITPADVSNTTDFRFEVIYWCLMTLYRGEQPDQLGRRMKFDEYKNSWLEQKNSRVFMVGGVTILAGGETRKLPAVANHDDGEFFPGSANMGATPYDSDFIANFTDHVKNRPGSL